MDKAAAECVLSLVPSTPKWVRMLRDFLQQAARQLWAEGLTHFRRFCLGAVLGTTRFEKLPSCGPPTALAKR
ncbi:MAG TPA: hypothetical protein VF756_01210 [Thermoanaerobaculia bacterium]